MSSPPVKLDPFKPTAPAIPGVPQRPPQEKKAGDAKPGPPKPSGPRPPWQTPGVMAGAAVVALGVITFGWWVLKPAPPPAPVVIEQPTSTGTPGTPAAVASSTPQLPDAPGPVATVDEMAKPWSVTKFQFHRKTGEVITGMVIRLPSPPGYWGFLSVAPYGRCPLELDTDLKQIREQYHYAAIHPMVVDSCTQVVYDPLATGIAAGVWIRGKVAAGPGIRPPLEVEIKVDQGFVIADRSE
ncbi:MAG TPA: hypothetical protein VKG84_06345 [Candidatus Acidoferrales bacterium]|nr:hypothetical protein [Candidatus Acidoferrales bacterium]